IIKYLYADNYKSLVNFKIDFSNLNILIGKNGCGKTSIFHLLGLLKTFVTGGERIETLFPLSSLTRWQQVNVQTFELGVSVEKQDYVYHLVIEHNLDFDKCRVKEEKVLCDNRSIFETKNGKAFLYNDSFEQKAEILTDWSLSGVGLIQERNDNKLLTSFKRALSNILICAPVPFCMNDRTDTENSMLSYRCENIAAVYRFVSQQYPEKIADLWKCLRDINPNLIRVYLDGGENEKLLKFEYKTKDEKNKNSYLLSELSEGEKMVFALYFIINCYGSEEYSLFVDEPDNFVELQEIQPWLQLVEDVVSESKAQCVIVSHHPEVIDYLALSNGVWFSRTDYGASRITKAPQSSSVAPYSKLILHGAEN